MARKRKQPPRPTKSAEHAFKQQQQEQLQLNLESEYKEDEQYEEEEEESQEIEEELAPSNETSKPLSTSSSPSDEEEPIQNLLESLDRNEIAKFLIEATSKHHDMADRIRRTADADADPAHRKIFVHGLSWDTTVDTLTSAFSPMC